MVEMLLHPGSWSLTMQVVAAAVLVAGLAGVARAMTGWFVGYFAGTVALVAGTVVFVVVVLAGSGVDTDAALADSWAMLQRIASIGDGSFTEGTFRGVVSDLRSLQ